MREQTTGCTLREIIELVLQHSGLEEHYKLDREGQERLENLAELVNAAESFVGQEGFGRDVVALPVDELGAETNLGFTQRYIWPKRTWDSVTTTKRLVNWSAKRLSSSRLLLLISSCAYPSTRRK